MSGDIWYKYGKIIPSTRKIPKAFTSKKTKILKLAKTYVLICLFILAIKVWYQNIQKTFKMENSENMYK